MTANRQPLLIISGTYSISQSNHNIHYQQSLLLGAVRRTIKINSVGEKNDVIALHTQNSTHQIFFSQSLLTRATDFAKMQGLGEKPKLLKILSKRTFDAFSACNIPNLRVKRLG